MAKKTIYTEGSFFLSFRKNLVVAHFTYATTKHITR
jgi:hypothetical protein